MACLCVVRAPRWATPHLSYAQKQTWDGHKILLIDLGTHFRPASYPNEIFIEGHC